MTALQQEDQTLHAVELEEALHELAQPLTALAFLTEVSLLQTNPAMWKSALEAAATETRRAVQCVRQAQDAAAKLAGQKEPRT